MKTKGSSPMVTAGRKIKRNQLFHVELVSDGPQKATGDSQHDLHKLKEFQYQAPFNFPLLLASSLPQKATGDSQHDLHKLKEFQYQAPFNFPLLLASSLKPLIRSQKHSESGKFGKRCTVETNYFAVSLHVSEVYQYDVCISPGDRSCVVNRAVIRKLVSIHASALNGCYAYDGRNHLYTAKSLPFTCKTFEIELQSVASRRKKFKVVIRFVANVGLQAGRHEREPKMVLQALEVILFEMFGRSCSIGKPLKREKGLEIQWSVNKSLQLTQKGLLLNIDVSSKESMNYMHVIDYITQLLDRNTLDSSLSDGDFAKIKEALEGVTVLVKFVGMCKSYRVLGPTEDATSVLCDQRGDKTFADYFQETYGYTIERTDLPCLKVGTNQMPEFFPVEVCKIAKRQLNRTRISTLKAAQLHPLERKYHTLKAVQGNNFEEPYAKQFGIEIKKEPVSIDARVLPPPWLKFRDGTGSTDVIFPQAGRWNMIRKRMFNGGKVSNWTCVNFSCDVENEIVRSFCHELAVVCNSSGMAFCSDPVIPVRTADPKDLELTLESCYGEAMSMLQQLGRELDLLVVILPNNKGSLYGNLKRICETKIGLVSQCCLAKHVSNMSKQYLTNVALKINVKVGGRNTVLADPERLPCVGDIPTIIFGAHVMHPGSSNSPSIAAVVASRDWPDVTNYAALACVQANGQEWIHDLFDVSHFSGPGAKAGGMIIEHLVSFYRKTGKKPQRIIYYRDSLSNRQRYQVMLQEVVAIKKACSYLEPGYMPSVTYVVLQKRQHARFFTYYNERERHKMFNGSGNVLPGTVVDSDICHPNEFGFYLCSQIGTQGTIQPVHYHILRDENSFAADTFQCLTNYLCYTYARCMHSISIVPPVFYARLMASRCRLYMESTTENVEDGHAPSPSEASSSLTIRCLPTIKDIVKQGMFYC